MRAKANEVFGRHWCAPLQDRGRIPMALDIDPSRTTHSDHLFQLFLLPQRSLVPFYL